MLPNKFITLVKKARQKNAPAMESLYDYYFNRLYGECFCVLKNPDDAYDVTTEVLLNLFTSSYGVDGVKNPDVFMWVAAKNASLNFLKKKSFSSPLDENIIKSGRAGETWHIDVINSLNDDENEILTLHISWGFSLKEISSVKNMSLATVRRRYKSVKEKIKAIYEQEKDNL